MDLLGNVVKRALKLRKTMRRVRRSASPESLQRKTLVKLLRKARQTEFGSYYGFGSILASTDPLRTFQERVPIVDYNQIHEAWWHKSLQGESNVCWPGRIKYFALSSGTSGSASKQLPITNAMIRSIRKTSIRQILSLVNYDLPEDLFRKGVLVVGGSSDLTRVGNHYIGDLSGISQAKMPFYTAPFYKPGKQIAKFKDWNLKIEEIVKHAPKWDIGMITGVPAWNQIILERIIKTYGLNNIHELWPNLSIFIYGGVALEPYKKSFESLLGKKVHYLETYLASEGFIAYQSRKDVKGMELVMNNGIFLEFVPFDSEHFEPDGQLKKEIPRPLLIHEVQEGQEYALLLSTNAGAWRYLIGDTIRFSSLAHREIIITGRTKHFLSLCGEHLSVDNMTKALEMLGEECNCAIPEFTVVPVQIGNLFGHKWYLGVQGEMPLKAKEVAEKIDGYLKALNDDYAVERAHALKEVKVELLSPDLFYGWMEAQGKMGSQNKFPRVLREKQLESWNQYLNTKQVN